jgi:hypothetical protein
MVVQYALTPECNLPSPLRSIRPHPWVQYVLTREDNLPSPSAGLDAHLRATCTHLTATVQGRTAETPP